MKTYTIGEVARLLGVKPFIIRYWEGELPLLAPRKSLSGRRTYSSREIQLLMRFKHLLYDKKFTLEGAKRTMWEELGAEIPDARLKIAEIRGELIDLLMMVQERKGDQMTEREQRERFTALGQGHLFEHWDPRPSEMKRRLLEDLETLDVSLLDTLRSKLREHVSGGLQNLAPAEYIPQSAALADAEARELGERLLREGKAGFITVAGGQGTRLGILVPKGTIPVSPIRKLSLFAVFAEKIAAARSRYGVTFPWLIMTSPLNHGQTIEFFEEEKYFGLGRENVRFFAQGTLPSMSPEGLLAMGEDGGLLQSPNGHGGVIEALRKAGLLDELRDMGVEELFYFQVDNPLVTIPDPTFLGIHRRARSLVSSKVIEKQYPEERLGSIALRGGKPAVIEYTDLSPDIMGARDAEGRLLYGRGSIATHVLNVGFLRDGRFELPYHLARKKARIILPNASGIEVRESEVVKFEMFVFDAILCAERAVFVETDRLEEFAPLKNINGVDSMDTCVRGQTEKFAAWLEASGVHVPRNEEGLCAYAVEISPHFAMERCELSEKTSRLGDSLTHDALLS
jgi:UDP-N-acetylglucosamine/UDP-N-acetylgalactosamine diphosphorylase